MMFVGIAWHQEERLSSGGCGNFSLEKMHFNVCPLERPPLHSVRFPCLIQENRDMHGLLLHKLLDGFFAFVGDDKK
jgi:hypothetical protein